MASSLAPKVQAFVASAAIAKGKVVKAGTDGEHIAVCSAATDLSFGILQTATTADGDMAEVAVPGGGGKALAGGVIAWGDLLTSDGNGALIATTTENDRVIAVAMQSAVANDLFNVIVLITVH